MIDLYDYEYGIYITVNKTNRAKIQGNSTSLINRKNTTNKEQHRPENQSNQSKQQLPEQSRHAWGFVLGRRLGGLISIPLSHIDDARTSGVYLLV